MDSDSEWELISLVTQLMSLHDSDSDFESKFISLINQIISRVRSLDFDLQPKPESKLMSLVTQTISLVNSMDLDSQPKTLLSTLISFTSQLVRASFHKFESLLEKSIELEPEPEFMSLIHQILSLVVSMNPKWVNLISLCPQVHVRFEEGKFHVDEEVEQTSNKRWHCFPIKWMKFSLSGEEYTHFLCQGCKGKNHEEHEEAPLEIKHPLHPKHSLQLALNWGHYGKCYCCDEYLKTVIYYCSACDYALNIDCVEKPPVLSIDLPNWHEHTLAHFPRHAPITCDLCALPDFKSSPIYMCPPCDFVVHKRCLKLPRVIRISRHPHRVSFTSSFDKGDWSCAVCRTKIENDYGGYSCIRDGCSYVAHSRCATQSNVWDGIELEGEPEEIEEEEVEPFMRISDGVIQHFCHPHHHMRHDDNTDRDYDEDKQCQACVMPIYSGNFYSCLQCNFILHETCANLPRRIYTPIHPHMLTLAVKMDSSVTERETAICKACLTYYKAGFFYECSKREECDFQLHVQCATISEPLLHGSHMHPLFLTSKPRERRTCCVCYFRHVETFNCIELECNFALCFACATLPQKVRYKHDKHMLTLSYGEEISTMVYWCEACERKINLQRRFYMCDEYCCVTLHIECLVGEDLYVKPGSTWIYRGEKVSVLPNTHRMSRPICSLCKKRCPYKIVFQRSGSIFCSVFCFI